MPETELEPPSVASPDPRGDDPRVGHLLGRRADGARAVLIGFPSDEGVRLNGGRPGAAGGPDAIRRQLYKLTPDARRPDAFVDLLSRTVDLGNLVLHGPLEDDQQRLGGILAPHLKRGAVPIVLGGGHETAFGHFLGYVKAEMPATVLNWDAHADVRPLRDGRAHSGSPFRQALEHPSGTCRGYTVAGLQPQSTARTHLDFLAARGGSFFWKEAIDEPRVEAIYDDLDGPCLTTFDLDAVDQARAPGVSAPNADGLSRTLWLRAAERAGCCPAVSSMDLVELSPAVDLDARTARLAALTVWCFLTGLAGRVTSGSQ
jgi:formiminoglutamase